MNSILMWGFCFSQVRKSTVHDQSYGIGGVLDTTKVRKYKKWSDFKTAIGSED